MGRAIRHTNCPRLPGEGLIHVAYIRTAVAPRKLAPIGWYCRGCGKFWGYDQSETPYIARDFPELEGALD